MEATIIGYGVVGKATAKSLAIQDFIDLNFANTSYEDAIKKPFIFLCLPTPTVKGTCNLTQIRNTLQKLADFKYSGAVVIRSTVTPGTCETMAQKYNLKIVSNPEFLKFATADYDALHPEMIVIGENKVGESDKLFEEYRKRFPKIKPIVTYSKTAEMIKYAFNNFLTLKIVYANEIYDVCERIGANYNLVKEALQSHSSGTKTHLDVIHDGGRGGGGPCLPKDTEAFASFSKSKLIKLINDLNNKLLQTYPKND